jgi:hypothetical protein
MERRKGTAAHAFVTASLLAPARASTHSTAPRAMRHSASACSADASSKMASCALAAPTLGPSSTSCHAKGTAPRRSLESPRMTELRPASSMGGSALPFAEDLGAESAAGFPNPACHCGRSP